MQVQIEENRVIKQQSTQKFIVSCKVTDRGFHGSDHVGFINDIMDK